MKKTVEILELENSQLENYIAQSANAELLRKKSQCSDLLVLPRNYGEQGYYFASESIDFVKFCKSQNADIEMLDANDIKVLDLHSFDIWMPLIYVGQEILLPLVISLVANFISSKKKGREHEKAKVNVDIVYKKGKKEFDIHYNGDADTFKDLMDKLDLK